MLKSGGCQVVQGRIAVQAHQRVFSISYAHHFI
jgi:hypothetical protein